MVAIVGTFDPSGRGLPALLRARPPGDDTPVSVTRRVVDRNGLEILTRDECLELIGQVPVGRIGVVVGGIPVVVPVNFTLLGEDIVVRTGTGQKLVAAVNRSAVSFEVDSLDIRAHAGWSVLVTGGASELTRPDERALATALGLEPWIPGRGRYIRIRSEVVSGRRMLGTGHAAVIPETEWDWG